MVLASAAAMNLKLRELDVTKAFLNSKLDEELYMKQPPGYEVKKGDYVCKLLKGLYGLKQSPRNWHKTIKIALSEIGFQRSSYVNCLFILEEFKGKQTIIVLSTTKAEYVAAATACKEGIWVRNILEDIGVIEETYIPLHTDSQSSVQLALNNIHHERNKHINVRWHYMRHLVQTNQVELKHEPTNRLVADLLTKVMEP
ncbi:unnamed protein product [Allacma fusca]|uniref:Reverse transcriptase Ty1/copia-type domain-containing protein n=1 Tax=Allacma fusca TaxID=39272 RepID=A0A8J2JKZ4_9HEXA|nr:unnamed protein product [Allacma fusca]